MSITQSADAYARLAEIESGDNNAIPVYFALSDLSCAFNPRAAIA